MKNTDNKEVKIKTLPTITTTSGSDWRNKIKEINELKITEIALFPTAIAKKERSELYELLKKSTVVKIPFVHLRSDMDIAELDYFIENYGTKVFNMHTAAEFPFINDWQKYQENIFVENVFHSFCEEEIKKFAGVCVDFSHLENDKILNKDRYERSINIIEKYRIGCGHISAIKKETYCDKDDKNRKRHDFHHLDKLSELDYLKNYPRKYFASYMAIELENSMKKQLEVRDHIEKIIKTLK